MKWFAGALLAALLMLQYRIWFTGDGVREVLRLRTAVAGQTIDNQRLSTRNRQLAAEVRDLKQGYTALEEKARTDLGMVGNNETFYQVTPSDAQSGLPAPHGSVPGSAAPSSAAPGGAAPAATHTAAR